MLRLHSDLSPPRSSDFCFDRTASQSNPGETLCILMCALEATSADEIGNITKATPCHDVGCAAYTPVNLEGMSLNRAQALSVLKCDATTGMKVMNQDAAVSLSDIIWTLEEDFYNLIKNPQEAGDEDFSVTSDLFDDDLTMRPETNDLPAELQAPSTLHFSEMDVDMDLEQSDPIIHGHPEHLFSTVPKESPCQCQIDKPDVQTDLITLLKTSKRLDENVLKSRMRPLMEKSIQSQEALQDWDRLNGLPASHSKTMVNTSRSRTQLLEGIILRKWDGSPLIPFVGESDRPV